MRMVRIDGFGDAHGEASRGHRMAQSFMLYYGRRRAFCGLPERALFGRLFAVTNGLLDYLEN